MPPPVRSPQCPPLARGSNTAAGWGLKLYGDLQTRLQFHPKGEGIPNSLVDDDHVQIALDVPQNESDIDILVDWLIGDV